MKIMYRMSYLGISCCLATVLGCTSQPKAALPPASSAKPEVSYYKVDRATAGSISGTLRFTGKLPARKVIDMSGDPACVAAHVGKAYDETLVLNANGAIANAFIYVKTGLEGKNFEVPSEPVKIDQSGCWFRPRVLGIQTNQQLEVVNSDPVTHNIHPMAEINREWNHSQGPGDAPLKRKFTAQEIMIKVKCNIHSWMHAYIGVVPHPYFAVSGADGSFAIKDLPPGTYTLEVWQEKLGTQELQVTVAPQQKAIASFTFKDR